jgi:hypothetical protein
MSTHQRIDRRTHRSPGRTQESDTVPLSTCADGLSELHSNRVRRTTTWWVCCGTWACWTPTSHCWRLWAHHHTSRGPFPHGGCHTCEELCAQQWRLHGGAVRLLRAWRVCRAKVGCSCAHHGRLCCSPVAVVSVCVLLSVFLIVTCVMRLLLCGCRWTTTAATAACRPTSAAAAAVLASGAGLKSITGGAAAAAAGGGCARQTTLRFVG